MITIYKSYKSNKFKTLKYACVSILIVMSMIGFSQSEHKSKYDRPIAEIEHHALNIVVTVDSLQELQSELILTDFNVLLEEAKAYQNLSFELVCNVKGLSKGYTKSMTLKIESTTENKDYFLSRIKKLKEVAINYYTHKN
ncbi:hypothetical protein [Winogradskyella sediminis]|uniref:hypothetical protein n=1 Tax=Winogradskyella sediminis TaxID=1382466 RepID=UPI003AA8DC85